MAEIWGFILILVFLLWVSYEVDKSKKARGEPGVPLLGHIFDSVSFNFREEVDGEDPATKDKKPATSVSKEPVAGSPKKHHHCHKHHKKRSNRTSTANKRSHHKKHGAKSQTSKDEVKSTDQRAQSAGIEQNE